MDYKFRSYGKKLFKIPKVHFRTFAPIRARWQNRRFLTFHLPTEASYIELDWEQFPLREIQKLEE